jgi:hypothetical protein
MKALSIFICILCFSAFAKAQDSTSVQVTPPKIAVKLMLEKKVILADTEITFIEVLEDSRCPKNVTCIWAGQAKVRLSVQPKGGSIEYRELTFSPGLQGAILIAETKDCQIVVDHLNPYPEASQEEAAKKGYYLSIRETPLQKKGTKTDPKNGFK